MQKIFNTQKITAKIYTVVAVLVFLYTLVFMTEYKDLFGLKLEQNSQISFFHDSILQTFNRQIFVLALFGIVIVVFSFLLESFQKVPDRFALIVIEAALIASCIGAVYALVNLQAVSQFYRGLDFQYLYLEGMEEYEMRFSTFRAGNVVYILQLISCAAYGIAMAASHITFVKKMKKGRKSDE